MSIQSLEQQRGELLTQFNRTGSTDPAIAGTLGGVCLSLGSEYQHVQRFSEAHASYEGAETMYNIAKRYADAANCVRQMAQLYRMVHGSEGAKDLIERKLRQQLQDYGANAAIPYQQLLDSYK